MDFSESFSVHVDGNEAEWYCAIPSTVRPSATFIIYDELETEINRDIVYRKAYSFT